MRKILAITGVRSEYFLQRPIFQAIMDHPELALQLVVTGAHLSPLHGHTVEQVEADGFPIVERIENLLYSDRAAGRLKSTATQLQLLSQTVDRLQPDILLVPTDREEGMTLALCAAYLHIPAVHYGAGDRVVGNVDDMVRHAISRLCHVMCTANEPSRERLVKAGEEPWRVHNVGSAGLDRLRTTPDMDATALAGALGVDAVSDPYVVIIQHPLSSEIETSAAHMEETLAAVAQAGVQAFISYPNSDAGSWAIVDVIERYAADHPAFHAFKNIPDAPFVNLLRGASALIGNSSMGLIECPFLKLAALNVGARQTAREHAENVFFVAAEREAIAAQLDRVLHDAETRERVAHCGNPFGDGHTGTQVAELLSHLEIDARLLNKDLTY